MTVQFQIKFIGNVIILNIMPAGIIIIARSLTRETVKTIERAGFLTF